MKKRMLIILVLTVALVGCSRPVREAKANAIRRESEIEAQATMTALADEAAILAATQDDRIARQENFLWWSTIVVIAMIVVLVSSGSYALIRLALAFGQRADLQAKLIHVNKRTRTWPVLLDIKAGTLVDLETGERARLDTVQQLDHRRLLLSGQARTTGLLTQAAEKIAKSTKDASPGDMLPAVGQGVPLLNDKEPDDDTPV